MPVLESQYLSPVWRDDIFKGRVAFVTGGAGTICSMQTRALVRLGANACIIGRNVEKTEQVAKDIATVRPGAKVIGIGGCDVRKPEALKDAADRCAKELGGIDFVIAGAAGNFLVSMEGMSSNAFKTVMEIDVLGTFNTIKATIPYLLKSSDARMMAVSATFHYTGMPMQGHVAAAKASVDSLMASVALEYGPRGITANIIAPGGIAETEGMNRLSSGGKDGERRHTSSIPTQRLGSVKDIADATVFLFSPTGSHVNGHVLVVDGGHWRRQGGANMGGADYQYPDFLLGDGEKPKVKL